MKDFKIVLLLLLLVLLLGACQGQLSSSQNTEKESHPLNGLLLLGERQNTYSLNEEEWIGLEDLEATFAIYSYYDANSSILSLVKGRQWHKFDVSSGRLIHLEDQSDWGSIQKDGDQLKVEATLFFAKLGYPVYEYEQSKVIGNLLVDSLSVILTGQVYQDDLRLVSKKVDNLKGIWLDQEESWNLIYTDDKEFVWVEAGNFTFIEEVKEEEIEEKIDQNPLLAAWDLYGNDSDQLFAPNLDVVIPKWLSLKEDGSINDLYRPLYHQNARASGVDLWVLVNNSFDPDLTAMVLRSDASRSQLVMDLMAYLDNHAIEGLNVDFENMHLEDSDAFVQFIAELYSQMQSRKLPLSVAVTVPGGSDNWSKVYDRLRLSEVSDYLTLMAYDQYWASSQTSGPVAGLTWVDGHLKDMLEEISSQKLILGLPFYTRVWYESISTEEANKMKVSSKSVYMSSPRQLIEDYNPVRVWDPIHSQYYFAYFKDDQLIKFWYDDEEAVGRKAALLHKYNLAGLAAWSLGFETPEVWQVLERVMEEGQ